MSIMEVTESKTFNRIEWQKRIQVANPN